MLFVGDKTDSLATEAATTTTGEDSVCSASLAGSVGHSATKASYGDTNDVAASAATVMDELFLWAVRATRGALQKKQKRKGRVLICLQ